MKRIVTALFLMAAAAGIAVARPQQHESSYVAREAETIIAEQRSREMASVTIGEIEGWSDRLRQAARKDSLVASSGGSSFMLPGLGQLKNGAAGKGALFLGGHLVLGIGSLVGSYFLLPADVRFGQLDYLRAPVGGIETAWKNHSLLDYLPAIGVKVAGHVLDMGLRALATHDARRLARERIDRGSLPPEATVR